MLCQKRKMINLDDQGCSFLQPWVECSGCYGTHAGYDRTDVAVSYCVNGMLMVAKSLTDDKNCDNPLDGSNKLVPTWELMTLEQWVKPTDPDVQITTEDLILRTPAEHPYGTGYVVETTGYRTPGDGGDSKWVRSSEVDIASRSPAQRGTASLTDAEGFVWHLVDITSAKAWLAVGAVGDAVTDSYAPMQALANTLSDTVNTHLQPIGFRLPTGEFLLSDLVVFSINGGSTVKGMTVMGAGPTATRLIAAVGNAKGCLQFTSNGNLEVWGVAGMAFLSALSATATVNNGDLLLIESTLARGDAGFGAHPDTSVLVKDVYVGPYGENIQTLNGGKGGNYHKGIHIRNKWYPKFDNVRVRGANDQDYTTAPNSRYAGIHLYDCFSPQLDGIYIDGNMQYGVRFDAFNTEDFRLTNFFIVGPVHGFSVLHSGQDHRWLKEPGGAISDGHVNCATSGIHILNARQIVIDSVYGYLPNGQRLNQDKTGTPSVVHLEGTSDITIDGCQFLEPGFYVDDDNTAVAIRVTTEAKATNITDTHFNNGGVSIYIDEDVDGEVFVTNPMFGGASIWGDGHEYVDKSGILVMFDKVSDDAITVSETITTRNTGGAPLIRTFKSLRSDFDTKSNPVLLNERVVGRTSTGEELFLVHEYSFIDNSIPQPIIKHSLYQRMVGGGVKLVSEQSLPPQDGRTSYVLVWLDGTTYKQARIQVGGQGSGPNGVGRALYI